MTLDDAIKKFESEFEKVETDPKAQEDKDLPVYWSGGKRDWSETSAVLCATKDMAIDMWLETVISYSRGENLTWVVRPELLEFMITIADKKGQHRAVNNRFAVKSQFKMDDANG